MNELFLLPVVSDCGAKQDIVRGNELNRMLEDVYLGAVQVESFETIPNYLFRKVLLIRASKIKLSNAIEPKEAPYLHQLPIANKYSFNDSLLWWSYRLVDKHLINDVDNKTWE